jgi:hypothetical protein
MPADQVSTSKPLTGDDLLDPARVDYAPKDRQQLWMAAIKPLMYSVGIIPVLVSGGCQRSWIVYRSQIHRQATARCSTVGISDLGQQGQPLLLLLRLLLDQDIAHDA